MKNIVEEMIGFLRDFQMTFHERPKEIIMHTETERTIRNSHNDFYFQLKASRPFLSFYGIPIEIDNSVDVGVVQFVYENECYLDENDTLTEYRRSKIYRLKSK